MAMNGERQRGKLRWGWILIWTAIGSAIGVAIWIWQPWTLIEHFEADPERLRKLETAALPADEARSNQPGDWAQWRGGVSTETGLLTEWPNDGPPVLWRTKVGVGYSAPVVANGRLYLHFREEPNEVVACWKADSGEELWRKSYPVAYQSDQGSGPRATAAVDGARVYTVGATGLFFCWDAATGRVLWKHDLPQEFEAAKPYWGVSFSPLVDDKYVYTIPGGPNGNSIAAFDKKSGTLAWKSGDDPASYSSPMMCDAAGVRQLLVFTAKSLVSVDPANGKIFWTFPWSTDNDVNAATPICVGDYVFISSGYKKGCALLEVSAADGNVQARRVYQHNRMRNQFATSVYFKEHLYGFDEKYLTCMDFRRGKIKWKEGGFDKRTFDSGSLTIADGHLIILGENGDLAVAEACPEGFQKKSAFKVFDRKCWTVPVVANGKLYVRDEEEMVCFELRKKMP